MIQETDNKVKLLKPKILKKHKYIINSSLNFFLHFLCTFYLMQTSQYLKTISVTAQERYFFRYCTV